MVVTKAADYDVFDKIDTQFISDQFAELENIGIVFICGKEGGEEDDWTEEDGMRYIVIHLPYEEVRQLKDIRPMMLKKAEERLGLMA